MTNSLQLTRALPRLLLPLALVFSAPLALAEPRAPLPPLPPLAGPASLPPLPSLPSITASRGLPLSEAVRVLVEDVLKKPFLFSSELVADSRSIALSSKLSPKTAEAVLDRILADSGYQVDRSGPVYSFKPLAPPSKDALAPGSSWLTYRPLYRPVSYFSSSLPALFPEAKFSFDKGSKSGDSGGSPDVFFASIPDPQRKPLLDALAVLDVPVKRVVIRAALFETTSDDREGSGVKFAAKLLSSRLGISLQSQGSGQTISFTTPNLDLALSALAADSRFKTLALPVLSLEHGSQGDFRVGTRIPLQKITQNEGTTTTSVEYQEVGTLLTVTPLVSGSTVTADISLELSDVAQTSVGTTTAPAILTRNLSLRTALESGSAVLLGNLRSERNDISSTGIFGLNLGSQRSKTSTDLLLLLYAEILPDPQGEAKGAGAPGG